VDGELKVTAAAELGQLGARVGPPATFRWTRSSLMPLLVPWLALLGLLAWKSNRGWPAWGIWLPLGLVAGFCSYARPLFHFMQAQALDGFAEVFQALAFGLAAVWLLGHAFKRAPRFAGFLGTFVILAGFSGLAFGVRQDWHDRDIGTSLTLLSIFSAVLSLSLSLAGYACRRRYGRLRLSLWVMACMVLALLAVATPFFLMVLARSGHDPRGELFFAVGVFSVALANFLILLPFLGLAFANAFYRQRLQALLHLPETPAATAKTG
jgi:hypothetical protein